MQHRKIDINKSDYRGDNLLIFAADRNNFEVLKFMVESFQIKDINH